MPRHSLIGLAETRESEEYYTEISDLWANSEHSFTRMGGTHPHILRNLVMIIVPENGEAP